MIQLAAEASDRSDLATAAVSLATRPREHAGPACCGRRRSLSKPAWLSPSAVAWSAPGQSRTPKHPEAADPRPLAIPSSMRDPSLRVGTPASDEPLLLGSLGRAAEEDRKAQLILFDGSAWSKFPTLGLEDRSRLAHHSELGHTDASAQTKTRDDTYFIGFLLRETIALDSLCKREQSHVGCHAPARCISAVGRYIAQSYR
jgi:hypothetical protein